MAGSEKVETKPGEGGERRAFLIISGGGGALLMCSDKAGGRGEETKKNFFPHISAFSSYPPFGLSR